MLPVYIWCRMTDRQYGPDAGPQRYPDPDVVVLEGSNDPNLTSYESGAWTQITTISNIAAGFTARFESQEFFFSNATPYRNYRWRVEATRTTPNRCCMQVAEVWLTTSAPTNQAGSAAAK